VRPGSGPFRRTLLIAQWLLFGAAVPLLGYYAWATADAWMFEHEQARRFDELRGAVPAVPALASVASIRASSAAALQEGPLGRIDIKRLGLSVMVVEGTTSKTLRRAAGHIEGTALPGQSGNIGISAHRDTFFRPLRNIRVDDVITLATLTGDYRYRVTSMKVVSPDDISVLAGDDNEEVLTLVTCYPFYYVGAAPDRFIVRASRTTSPATE
jgi:sortase A